MKEKSLTISSRIRFQDNKEKSIDSEFEILMPENATDQELRKMIVYGLKGMITDMMHYNFDKGDIDDYDPDKFEVVINEK